MVTEFDRWVGGNNIPARFEYGKGWWDYVELVRRLASTFDIEDVRVVGHYVMDTPPPEEKLPMPVVALTRRGVLVALKHDFDGLARWPKEWTVSVRRTTPSGTDPRAVRSHRRSATGPRRRPRPGFRVRAVRGQPSRVQL